MWQSQKQARLGTDHHGTDNEQALPSNRSALQVVCTLSDSVDTHYLKTDMKQQCSQALKEMGRKVCNNSILLLLPSS